MPIELQIIRANEFVRAGARGVINFDESKATLQQLAQACRKRGVDRALLDLRELPIPPKPVFSPTDLAALVATFKEAGFTRSQRLAVLYKTDPHHGARMFAFIGSMRGWKVRAFKDFEAALFWLGEEGKKSERDEVRIPVSHRTTAGQVTHLKPRTPSRTHV